MDLKRRSVLKVWRNTVVFPRLVHGNGPSRDSRSGNDLRSICSFYIDEQNERDMSKSRLSCFSMLV